MLNLKIWTVSLACWMAVSFTLCIVGGVIVPDLPIPHRTLELLLPGFTWISMPTYLLGLIESATYGVFAAWLFVSLHNYFARRWATPALQQSVSTTK